MYEKTVRSVLYAGPAGGAVLRLRLRLRGGRNRRRPAQRSDPLRLLRAPVRGDERRLFHSGGAGNRADQRRRSRQGHDRCAHRPVRHRSGGPGGLHLRTQPGQGRGAPRLRPADQAGRLVPGGPRRGGLFLAGPEGENGDRRPEGRRSGNDAGVCHAPERRNSQ